MDHIQTYVEKMLESSSKVMKVAEAALNLAEKSGLTLEETEQVPETITSILKEERYKNQKKYKRPNSTETEGSEN